MTSQAGYFEPSKSSHITLFPSSNQRLKSELTTEAGFVFEAHSWTPEQDAKLAKIRDSDLLNEGPKNQAVTTFTLLVGTSLLLMVLI